MNKKIIALSVTILLAFALMGCQPAPAGTKPLPPQSGSEVPDKIADDQFKVFPFAHQIKGGYDEDLFNEQVKLQAEGKFYYTIIENAKGLKDLIEKRNLVNDMGEMSLNYTDKFFRDHKLIAVFPQQGSSSVNYAVTSISPTETLIDIILEQNLPEIQTTDLVNKGFLIGMKKEELLGKDSKDKVIHVTMKTIRSNTNNIDKSELTVDDLMLGNLKLQITAAYVDRIMNTMPIRVKKEMIGSVESEVKETREYDGIDAIVQDNELTYLSTTSEKYPTPRGLKVGDTVETLIDLYGKPSQVAEDKNTNTKIYSFDLSGEYFLFHAEVKDGKIIRLQVNLAC